MPGILHYAPLHVSTAYLFNQINGLQRYTPFVLGKPPGKGFEYNTLLPLTTDIKELTAFVNKNDIRAIHAHFGHHGEKVVMLSRQLHLPLITSIRGGEASNHPERLKKSEHRYKNVKKYGALFLPVCQHFAPLLENLGFPGDKIETLYGGIDVDLFQYQPRKWNSEKIRLITVGKTAPKKGYKYLIKAFSRLIEKYPCLELIIVTQNQKTRGDMKEKVKLKDLILEFNLVSRVTFKTDLTEPEIAQELHQAHLYIQSSVTTSNGNIEGIPNALKEAMATGMPVVATSHAGIPELVQHEKSGLLVKEKNVDQMVSALSTYLSNPEIWVPYGLQARSVVEERFNLMKQIPYQEDLYDKLLGVATLSQEES